MDHKGGVGNQMVEKEKEARNEAACIATSRPSAPICSKKELISGCMKIKGMEKNPPPSAHKQISGSTIRLASGPTRAKRLKE